MAEARALANIRKLTVVEESFVTNEEVQENDWNEDH